MEYDSRPKIKLFVIADKEEETKELFFVGRKAMAIIGSIAGLLVAGIIYFSSKHLLVSMGIGLAVGLPMAVFPILMDKRREAYFTPLINKMIELLETFEIAVTKEEVMNLLSFKKIRINNEHLLMTQTISGSLEVYVATDVLPEKVKVKKGKTFAVKITETAGSEVKTFQADNEEETDQEVIEPSETQEDLSGEETPEPQAEDEAPKAKESNVEVSTFTTSGKEYTAVSTDAMSIVAPPPESDIATIGEVAPGVTGPIPITVGDRSIIHPEDSKVSGKFGSHVKANPEPEPDLPENNDPPKRRGRRSAIQ